MAKVWTPWMSDERLGIDIFSCWRSCEHANINILRENKIISCKVSNPIAPQQYQPRLTTQNTRFETDRSAAADEKTHKVHWKENIFSINEVCRQSSKFSPPSHDDSRGREFVSAVWLLQKTLRTFINAKAVKLEVKSELVLVAKKKAELLRLKLCQGYN